jgi:hypothetical protein
MLAAELSKMAENHPINEMSPLEIALGFTGATTPARGIRAYHGSPHKFDRFSMENIGTGEGAQAYGHGLYMAEARGTAQNYRDRLNMLQRQRVTYNGQPVDLDTIRGRNIERAKTIGKEKTIKKIEMEMRRWPSSRSRATSLYNIWKASRDEIAGIDPARISIDRGHMYEVNIKADPEDFLDWDAPLSAQSEGIQQALKDAGLLRNTWAGHLRDLKATGEFVSADRKLNLTGAQFYHDMGAKASASEALRKAGIKGIKYKDQMSRGKEGGTHNYVTFSDDIIEIIRRYGILPLIGGAGGGGLAAAMSGQVFPEGGGA